MNAKYLLDRKVRLSVKDDLTELEMTELAWLNARLEEFPKFNGIHPRFEETARVLQEAVDQAEVVRWEGRVSWNMDHPYLVMASTERMAVTELNRWNMDHLLGVYRKMRDGQWHHPPSGRLYRIDADDVEDSTRWFQEGMDVLSYQTGLLEPWGPEDVGEFHVQLLDGNHRSMAAMLAGERWIPFIVGPNYRDDVRPGEWVSIS